MGELFSYSKLEVRLRRLAGGELKFELVVDKGGDPFISLHTKLAINHTKWASFATSSMEKYGLEFEILGSTLPTCPWLVILPFLQIGRT